LDQPGAILGEVADEVGRLRREVGDEYVQSERRLWGGEKLTSMVRHRDASGEPSVPQASPVATNSGPVDPAAVANPPVFPDQPAA
jgi:hypothetical protein